MLVGLYCLPEVRSPTTFSCCCVVSGKFQFPHTKQSSSPLLILEPLFLPTRQSLFYFEWCWKILSCTPDKDIRVFYLDRRFFSCIPDKDIRVFCLDRQFLSHPCYLTQDRIKITCIQCIGCIRSRVSTSSSDIGLYNRYVKNDVTLCKLDVNVTAVAGSVDFFKLQWKLFKGKSVT